MVAAFGGDDDGPLRGLEGLAVAEAAELANLEVLGGLALAAQDGPVGELVEWALPLQERHVTDLRDAGLVLAAQVDPDAPAETADMLPRGSAPAPGPRGTGSRSPR